MSFNAKVIFNGKNKLTTVLFGYRGRDGNKIYQKQMEMCKELNKILKGSFINCFPKKDKQNFEDLLEKICVLIIRKESMLKMRLCINFFNK